MALLQVGNRTFRDIDSYNCARRDLLKINDLKEKVDLTRVDSIQSLLDDIDSGKYRFESLLGDDFYEELEDLKSQLVKEVASDNKKTKDKTKSKKENKIIEESKHEANDDDLLEIEIRRQVKRNELKRKMMLCVLGLIFVACVGYLIFYYALYVKNGVEYDNLSELVQDNYIDDKPLNINIVQEDKTKPPILKKYETLYQKNKKLVGWLKIDGTNIDYPVLQTVNNEYYLDHNYNQEYDKNGSIFMDKDCDPAHPNDNMIIYGHHMKSGKMFGNLNYFAREDFYKEHPTIQFDTIYEEGTYAIMYVFRSRIYSEEEIIFKYYKFIDATSEQEFNSNMQEMNDISLYDTGVTAKYGDKLITLSTCDSSETNGRFVVVAKKVK